MHFQTFSYQLLDFDDITRLGVSRINIIIIFYLLLSFPVSRVYYITFTTCHLFTAAVVMHYDCIQSSCAPCLCYYLTKY